MTDEQWQAIEQAAAPQVGSASARKAVEKCLRDYRGLRAFVRSIPLRSARPPAVAARRQVGQ